MALATPHRPQPLRLVPAAALGAGHRTAAAAVAAAALAGSGIAVLVARDGYLPWQVARTLAALAVTAGAVAVLGGRARARVRGAVAVALGIVATSVGVGIGVPHTLKSGLGVTSVAGLAALLGGLALLVGGTVGLVRAARRWWRLLAVPAAYLLLQLLLLPLPAALYATNVPRAELGARTPADLGLDYETVDVRAADGVRLAGWYVPGDDRAAVVLLHGAGSTRTNVLDHAAVLAGRGYGVLLVDARGHGESAGRAMDLGWHGDDDVTGAVTYLTGRPDVDADRIGVVGMSMGGEEAIGAAAADERIAAVVAEGATGRSVRDLAWTSGVDGWVHRAVSGVMTVAADLLTRAAPPRPLDDAVVAAAPRPVLLIAAGDVSDESEVGRHLVAASPGSVTLWVAPDTPHTDALERHPSTWEERVIGFLDGALGQ